MSISGYISMINEEKTINFSVLLIRNYQLYGVLVDLWLQLEFF